MTKHSPQQWELAFYKEVPDQLSELPDGKRRAVFDSIRQALESDNPYALSGVKKLKNRLFCGSRRVRVGDVRWFFHLEDSTRVRFEAEYKGTLVVEAVLLRRDCY